MLQLSFPKDVARLCLDGIWQNHLPLKTVVVHKGNHKIPSSTAIFNMSSARDCPSKKLGLCRAYANGKHICYAKRAENSSRPNVLPFRRKQQRFWKKISAESFVSQFLLWNATKDKPFTAIRFNEAGDFLDQDSVDKAEQIAKLLKKYGIICYCYTSRSDLDYSKVKTLRVSGSGFVKKGIRSEFKIILNINDRPKGYGICGGNCRICDRCMRSGLKTVVLRH